MHVRSTAAGLEVLAPAKVNLFLEVLAKRADGFHELETLMYPIALFDTLLFQPDPSGEIRLTCKQAVRPRPLSSSADGSHSNNQAQSLPVGPDNLVVRAVELVRRRVGFTGGARLRLIKRIPLAAGLAGGSSDAAAALVAANRAWRLDLSPGDLAHLAAELGSDIPFFLGRGPAICRGRGEIIEPVEGLGSIDIVVVRPPDGLSTAAVYRACRPAERAQSVGSIVDYLRRGWRARAASALHNRLQAAAETLSPWIARLEREFSRLDCLGHRMSGSGTSYFGLCRSARHARRVAARLAARGVGQVYAVEGTC